MNEKSKGGKNEAYPITTGREVKNSPDAKIDQDFSGFPFGNAKRENIKPDTDNEKKVAAVN